MNLLLLGGNSQRNQAWVKGVAENLKDIFDDCKVQNYKHWETGDQNINFDYELEQLASNANAMQPVAIFAKSVGSHLTLKAASTSMIDPKFCLLVGFPLSIVADLTDEVEDWIKGMRVPTVVAQNNADPLGSFEEVKNYVDACQNPNVTVVELKGDTHDYDDIEKIRELLVELKSNT